METENKRHRTKREEKEENGNGMKMEWNGKWE